MSPEPPVHQRLARPHGDAPEAEFHPGGDERLLHEVVVADRSPAERHQHVGLHVSGPADRLIESAPSCRRRCRDRSRRPRRPRRPPPRRNCSRRRSARGRAFRRARPARRRSRGSRPARACGPADRRDWPRRPARRRAATAGAPPERASRPRENRVPPERRLSPARDGGRDLDAVAVASARPPE